MSEMEPPFIDAHLHLLDPRFLKRVDGVIADAAKVGVCLLFSNAVEEADWKPLLELGSRFEAVVPFLGIHPWFAEKAEPGWEERLFEALEPYPGLSGIGECGLDRVTAVDFKLQVNLLTIHLELAHRLSLPIAIHCVRSWGPLVETLESCARDNRLPSTMIHSYSGSVETMKRLTRLGCFLSYSVSIVDQRFERARQALIQTPAGQLLLETDAPGNPVPQLSDNQADELTTSEPTLIPAFYQWVADQRKDNVAELKSQILNNAQIYTNRTSAG